MVFDGIKVVSKSELRSLIQHQNDATTMQLIDEILDRGYEGEMREVKNAGSVVKCGWAFALNPEILADLMQWCVGKTVLELAGADGDNALCLGLAGAEKVYLNELVEAEVDRFKTKVQRLSSDLQKKFYVLPGDCFEVFKNIKYEGFFDLIYARNILHFFLGEKRGRFIRLLN